MTVESISSADSKTGQSTGRLASLDWLRGIASLWVLFYHIDITMQKEKYFAAQPLSDLVKPPRGPWQNYQTHSPCALGAFFGCSGLKDK